MSLSPLNHRAKHFLGAPWPSLQQRTLQSTAALVGLTSRLALVVCLSPAADVKLSFVAFCLCPSSALFLCTAYVKFCYTLSAGGNVISLFSRISFVPPFFSWYFLSQSNCYDHSPFDNISLERGFLLPFFGFFWGIFLFVPRPFESLPCHYLLPVSLCVAVPVLSGSARCRLKSIHGNEAQRWAGKRPLMLPNCNGKDVFQLHTAWP